jgi:hypothetical protein
MFNNKLHYETAQVDLRLVENSSKLPNLIKIVFEKDPFTTQINNLRKKQEKHLVQLSEQNFQTEDNISLDLHSGIYYNE